MKTNDPFNTEPLVQKRNEIDAELEKNHPQIKALQDVDDAITNIIDEQETAKEKVYEVEITETKKYIKQIKKDELPLYFHWGGGLKTWLYKVFEVNNEIKADKIIYCAQKEQIEYTSVPVELAFNQDHVAVEKHFWNEALQLLYKKASNNE